MPERIILLHGIVRTAKSMAGLGKYLESKNYDVVNIDYPSTKHDIAALTTMIAQQIPQDDVLTHFVGYSMGGLLVRALLTSHRPKNLGRVVMLGTPNKGSEVANFLRNFFLYKKFYGAAGQQLVTEQKDIEHLFGKVDYELGIIAGNRTVDPFCYFLLPRPNDGKVSTKSTKLEGMKEHIVIPATHTFFPHNRKAWKLTHDFIKTGSFNTNNI